MDVAIVTGASTSLGIAISKRLIQLGFRVYGLGGDYSECPLRNVNFKPLKCDLADPESVREACEQVLEKEKGVYLLVNNAKYFGRTPFPEMDPAELERVLKINLLCPLVLVRTLLESLVNLQGYVIQLGTTASDRAVGGPVGAASAGGLKWMGESLFRDLRDNGVKVCHLCPEPNRQRDTPSAARPGARMESSIDPEAVASAVEQILQSPFGNVVTELILRPLRRREPEHEPVVRLPYPEPKPVPYTVPREFIEAEDQLDEEAWQKAQRKKRQKRREKRAEAKSGEPRKDSGRKPKPSKEPVAETPEPNEPAKPREPEKPRRRSRRKPKPPVTQVGFLDERPESRPEPAPKPAKETKEAKPAPKSDPESAAPKDKPEEKAAPAGKAAKKAVKKAARKAAKKAVKKAAKKAARKVPAKKAAKKATRKTTAKKRTAKKAAES